MDTYRNTNRVSKKVKKRLDLALSQSGKCFYCQIDVWVRGYHDRGDREQEATIDHILPRSLGGRGKRNNFLIACSCCNRVRGNYPIEDFVRIRKLSSDWERVWNEYRNSH